METKTDRRILRTKKAINMAFMELITEKKFDQITINDLSERADVNRGTFYLHYMDKYDLLDQFIDNHLNRMIHSCTFSKFTEENVGKTEAIKALKSLFNYFEENFTFFYSMLSCKKTSPFREQLVTFFSSAICNKIDMEGLNQNMDKEIMLQFLSAAFVGAVENWFLNHMPHSPQWMAEQIWELLERNNVKP